MSDYFGAIPGGLFDNPKAAKPHESLVESKQVKREAFKRSRCVVGKQTEQVLTAIQAAGGRGVTRQQIAGNTGLKLSSVCGRVNDLLNATNDGGELSPVIFVKGRRDGSGVCFAKGYC